MDSRLTRPLALAATAFAGVFALMIAAYYVGPVARWDATALQGLRTLSEHRWIWDIGDFFAISADPEWIVAALVCICAAGLLAGRRRHAVAAALLVAGAGLVGALFKVLAAHPRFHPVLGGDQLSDTAFPSGHAIAAMSISLAAVLVAKRGPWRLAAAVAGGAYTLAVSISLVVQGWHFPSDVLAGLLVSSAMAMVVLAALRRAEGVSRAPTTSPPPARSRLSLRSDGIRVGEVLGAGLALGLTLIAVAFPGALASFAATYTSGLAAATVIALAAILLVSALTVELEAG